MFTIKSHKIPLNRLKNTQNRLKNTQKPLKNTKNASKTPQNPYLNPPDYPRLLRLPRGLLALCVCVPAGGQPRVGGGCLEKDAEAGSGSGWVAVVSLERGDHGGSNGVKFVVFKCVLRLADPFCKNRKNDFCFEKKLKKLWVGVVFGGGN
jgi:hypothetical protein